MNVYIFRPCGFSAWKQLQNTAEFHNRPWQFHTAPGSRMSCFQAKFKEAVIKENVSSKFIFPVSFFFVICCNMVPNGFAILI